MYRSDLTLSERLLADLWGVFPDVHAMWTQTILAKLHEIGEAPWADWYGRPLNARDLARLLHPFGAPTFYVRVGEVVKKGYRRADLHDAWSRYPPPPGPPPEGKRYKRYLRYTAGQRGWGMPALLLAFWLHATDDPPL